jgi:hypothetical protein
VDWNRNSAWLQLASLACCFNAWLRHIALDGDLAKAEPQGRPRGEVLVRLDESFSYEISLGFVEVPLLPVCVLASGFLPYPSPIRVLEIASVFLKSYRRKC